MPERFRISNWVTIRQFSYSPEGEALSVKYNGTDYYYIRNLQGDVTGIYNYVGSVVVKYAYDAWGKIISVTGSMTNTLGKLNPFRYRSYIYDEETGFYYLQSRYYDPEIGRFINADIFVSTGTGLNGFNMFAYCGNNPVVNIDITGMMHVKGTDGVGASAVRINNQVSDNASFLSKIIADCKNFDIYNKSEEVVLEANYFSIYKGILTVRTSLSRSGSFGVLFISLDANDREYAMDEVRHEYGHTVQLSQLGIINYIICIAIPSMFEWGNDPVYYRRQWEITADIFGNVQSRSYPEYEKAGFEYLSNSKDMGIFTWFTIK